jgi:hypothetical protein
MTGTAADPAIADAGTEKPMTWADAVTTATAEMAGEPAPTVEAEPKPEAVEQQPEAKPEEKPVGADKVTAAATAADIWANATPEQRAALDALNGNVTRYRNMVVPLQRKVSDLEHRVRTAPATPAASKPAADPAKAERLKRAKEEFPDVVEPIVNELDEIRAEQKTTTAKVQSFEDERRAQAVQATNDYIFGTHPDFNEVGQSDAFTKWGASHPDPLIRGAYERNKGAIADVVEAVAVVTRFKQDTAAKPAPAGDPSNGQQPKPPATPDPKRARQLATAAAPRTTTPARVSNEPPAPGTPGHWEWAVKQAQKELATGI